MISGAEQGVRVEVHLGVERHHAAVAGQDQRVDLGKRGIGLPESLVQPLQRARACGTEAAGTPIFAATSSASASVRPRDGSTKTL